MVAVSRARMRDEGDREVLNECGCGELCELLHELQEVPVLS